MRTYQADALMKHLLAACPDAEAKALAVRFFRIGAQVSGSDNAVGIVLDGFREALSTWEPQVAHRKVSALRAVALAETTEGGEG